MWLPCVTFLYDTWRSYVYHMTIWIEPSLILWVSNTNSCWCYHHIIKTWQNVLYCVCPRLPHQLEHNFPHFSTECDASLVTLNLYHCIPIANSNGLQLNWIPIACDKSQIHCKFKLTLITRVRFWMHTLDSTGARAATKSQMKSVCLCLCLCLYLYVSACLCFFLVYVVCVCVFIYFD